MNAHDAELARSLIDYQPETGRMTWKARPTSMFSSNRACSTWNARYVGTEALRCDNGCGYRRGSLLGKLQCAHRVAWLITYGEWPKGEIDHINGNRSDNRIANLRCVSHAENGRNQKRSSTNTSGVTGVHWYAALGKWQAHITVNGKLKPLGYFADIHDAIAARKAAEVDHGFHENHGRAA